MNKIILVMTLLMVGNLALADCIDDNNKFLNDSMLQNKKEWENSPKVPNPATRESMAKFDVMKAAFRKKMDENLEKTKGEWRRRGEECRKLRDAEIQAQKSKR